MRVLDRVTALNLALIMAHQADAAYWEEWEIFGLPGRIQFFDLFNVVVFLGLVFAELRYPADEHGRQHAP